MGQEVVCTARWGGKSVRGKALLETAEIIFRGDERRKIPFASLRGMESKDGELRLKTDEGQHLLHEVLLVLHVAGDAPSRRDGAVVPALGVH